MTEIVQKDRVLSSQFLNIDLAKIKTKTGKLIEHFVIDPLTNAVAAVVVRNGKIVLVKAKRLFWNNSWEIPGGWMIPGEIARKSVRRKVEEETGFEVLHIERIGKSVSDISLNSKEKFYFLVEVGNRVAPYNDEIVERVSSFTLAQIKQFISNGNIIDERTLTGLMLAENKGYIR